MTSFFQTTETRDPDAVPLSAKVGNPWSAVLAVLATVLLLGGVISVAVGLGVMANFGGTVIGQVPGFDQGAVTAIVGGVAIVLGILVGTVWLALGALGWSRRA